MDIEVVKNLLLGRKDGRKPAAPEELPRGNERDHSPELGEENPFPARHPWEQPASALANISESTPLVDLDVPNLRVFCNR